MRSCRSFENFVGRPPADIGSRRLLSVGSLREALPPGADDVAVLRVELDQVRGAPRALGGDEGGAAAGEAVEHRGAGVSAVANRPLDELGRLHRRVLFAPLRTRALPDGVLLAVLERVVRSSQLP